MQLSVVARHCSEKRPGAETVAGDCEELLLLDDDADACAGGDSRMDYGERVDQVAVAGGG